MKLHFSSLFFILFFFKVSAIYANCEELGFEIEAALHTKSKFLGLSISCDFIGDTIVRFRNEKQGSSDCNFSISLPTLYGRSIMTQPWAEFGGKFVIQALFNKKIISELNFRTKQAFFGKKHSIDGKIFTEDKKFHLNGNWTNEIYITVGTQVI